MAVINAIYELPFGRVQALGNDCDIWKNGFGGGWSLASIVTIQLGFAFTPQLIYNRSNN